MEDDRVDAKIELYPFYIYEPTFRSWAIFFVILRDKIC